MIRAVYSIAFHWNYLILPSKDDGFIVTLAPTGISNLMNGVVRGGRIGISDKCRRMNVADEILQSSLTSAGRRSFVVVPLIDSFNLHGGG